MITTRLTSEGRVVIPAEIRRRHGLRKGTCMAIEDRGDEIVLTPLKAYFDKFAGVIEGGPSLCDEIIREHAEEREREDRSQ